MSGKLIPEVPYKPRVRAITHAKNLKEKSDKSMKSNKSVTTITPKIQVDSVEEKVKT